MQQMIQGYIIVYESIFEQIGNCMHVSMHLYLGAYVFYLYMSELCVWVVLQKLSSKRF